jgi:serine/threonine protein phosphatase PrpC
VHHNDNFEDAWSGTTAISAFVQGRRNRITISNVGDSRAVLGKRVKINEDTPGKSPADKNNVIYRAYSLSQDQTLYRKQERKRIYLEQLFSNPLMIKKGHNKISSPFTLNF